MSSIPRRLAVLPRSRFEATRVARRMRSLKLAKLPREFVLLGSTSRRGGRRRTGGAGVMGVVGIVGGVVPCSIAPPFSKLPKMVCTRGSSGGVWGDSGPNDEASRCFDRWLSGESSEGCTRNVNAPSLSDPGVVGFWRVVSSRGVSMAAPATSLPSAVAVARWDVGLRSWITGPPRSASLEVVLILRTVVSEGLYCLPKLACRTKTGASSVSLSPDSSASFGASLLSGVPDGCLPPV